jgi:hypothetical protein
VRGYKTTDNANQTETLYAVYENGAIYKTNPLDWSNTSFDRMGRKWHKINELLADAEFIGNYVPPVITD